MVRSLALAAGLALLAASLAGADETFPNLHNEPIFVRVLDGQSGHPLAHLHLVLIAGYDQRDLHDRLWREEVLTDEQGRARLSAQLANLPWLQVWPAGAPSCQPRLRASSFSVERIRRDGLSAPNRCGLAAAEDAPGVFTVFVKGKSGVADAASASSPAPAPDAPAPLAAPAAPAAPAEPCCACCSRTPRPAASLHHRIRAVFDQRAWPRCPTPRAEDPCPCCSPLPPSPQIQPLGIQPPHAQPLKAQSLPQPAL